MPLKWLEKRWSRKCLGHKGRKGKEENDIGNSVIYVESLCIRKASGGFENV